MPSFSALIQLVMDRGNVSHGEPQRLIQPQVRLRFGVRARLIAFTALGLRHRSRSGVEQNDNIESHVGKGPCSGLIIGKVQNGDST